MREGLGGRRDSRRGNWSIADRVIRGRPAISLWLGGGLALATLLALVVVFAPGQSNVARAQLEPPPPQCLSPVDISFVFDHSGSMSQPPSGGGAPKLTTARNAVIGFIDALAGPDNDLTPHQMGLVGFSDGVASTDSNLTTNASLLKSILGGYSASGFTNIGRAVQLGQNVLKGQTDPDFMVLISDGSANSPQNLADPDAINNIFLDVNDDGFIDVQDIMNFDYPAPETGSAADFRVTNGELLISNINDLVDTLDVNGDGLLDDSDDFNFGPGKNFSIIDGTLYLDANGDGNFEETLLSPPAFALGHTDELTALRSGDVWEGTPDYSGDGSDVYAQYAATQAKSAGTTVYVIAYDVAASQDANLLQSMATSPSTYFNGGPDQINQILGQILQDICDITITKTLTSANNVQAGDNVTFQIAVTNDGSLAFQGVHVSDTYDTNKLQFVSAVPAPDSNADDGTLDWSNLAHSPADGTPTVWESAKARTITVNFVAEDGPETTQNCASVHADLQSDPGVTLLGGPACASVNVIEPSGSLQVCKDVVPNDSSTWNFSVTGPSSGPINGLGDGQCQTVTGLPAGPYTIAETTQFGYATAVNCGPNGSDVDNNITIQLSGGENASCTFTNTSTASIQVCKNVVPDDGSTWNFALIGPTPGNTTLGDGQCHTFGNRAPGSYTVTETTQDGYSTTVNCGANGQDSDGNITFTLSAGEQASCTFINTSTASIEICKDVVPNDASTWNFTAAGPTAGNVNNLGDGQCQTLLNRASGSYTVTETMQGGYTTAVNCGVNGQDTDNNITFALSPGEKASCTFTNTSAASVEVCKHVVPSDGGATSWNFGLAGPTPGNASLIDGQCFTFGHRAPGSYTVMETTQAGYSASVNCGANGSDTDGDLTFALSPGENASCAFTNTSTASIQICKDVVPNDASTWNFTAAGPTTGNVSNLGDGQCQTLLNRAPGSYTVTETPQAAYDTSVNCGTNGQDTDNDITFTLDPGENASCTFTNTKHGAIQVCKDVVPNDATVWDFTVSGPDAGTINDLGDGGCQTLTDRSAGSYTIAEAVQGGYTTGVSCGANGSDTDSDITFMLDPGENATCTFTNTLITISAVFTVNKDFVPNNPANVNITLVCTSGGVANTDPTASESDAANFNVTGALLGATCTATEAVPLGYAANQSDCVNVPLTTGTCTIVNTLITIGGGFSVHKDFIPDNPADVNVTLACTSGSVQNDDTTASEADAANFTVNGAVPSATCTATEAVPMGYSANQSDCVNVPLTKGTCTIVNTLIPTEPPTPKPTPSPTIIESTETPKPTPSGTPGPTPTDTPPPTGTPPGSHTPTATGTATPTPTGTGGPTNTPVESFTPPPTVVRTETPVPTEPPTPTPTVTPGPTASASPPALTATSTPMPTPTSLPAVFPPTGGGLPAGDGELLLVLFAIAGLALLAGTGLIAIAFRRDP